MARYQVGDFVAVINKLDRCGTVVSVDEKGKGYKVSTGKDEVFRYENELAAISAANNISVSAVMQKIDLAVGTSTWFTVDFRKAVVDFLNSNTGVAKAFSDYIAKVHGDVIAACLRAIKDSGLQLPQAINFTINININFIKIG